MCAYFDKSLIHDSGGQVPSSVMSIFDVENVDDGQVPFVNKYNNINRIPSPLVSEVKPSSALVFIEELIEEEKPAARSFGRFGVTPQPPMAFVGTARRCEFCENVATLSYIDSELGDDFLMSWICRSESWEIVKFPQPDDARGNVPDTAGELPTSSSREPDFPGSRKTVTHLAHAVAR